jgi:hypothetical protein
MMSAALAVHAQARGLLLSEDWGRSGSNVQEREPSLEWAGRRGFPPALRAFQQRLASILDVHTELQKAFLQLVPFVACIQQLPKQLGKRA